MKDYPAIVVNSVDDLFKIMRYIIKERPLDVRDFDNLKNIFMSGRKVGKIPGNSLDVVPTDRIGDFNYTQTYFYLLIDNSGTPEWRRISLGSW